MRLTHFIALVMTLSCVVVVAGAGCKRTTPEHAQVTAGKADCTPCHTSDYEATTEPVHAGLFETDCVECHNTQVWQEVPSFDHNQWFVLAFKHAEVACTSCHSAGYEAGTTKTTCVGCHQADADGTTDPVHTDFPKTCSDCHSERGFRPAVNHPEALFPRMTQDSSHSGIACAGCHNAKYGSNTKGMNTDCVGCHDGAHERVAMAERHAAANVTDYPPNDPRPNFCLSCHPHGQL